ncbi:adhesin; outer membrane autotransporter barrel [Escherichia coli]|uniref:Adhesin outer membrane autotransporter barrel n=1 Tax=Escherichia coli TaxID=562 RepID=A0A485JJM8_ECOLX|nr:adhesin; outer membrane autotransporter barrel [Escherichia coli]
MRFVLFCPSGIVPAQFAALSTGSVGNVTCIRTEEELRNKLRHRPQSVVISAGRPAECAEMWFRFYRDHSFVVVLCVAPFFLPPDVSISGVLKNLRLLKPGMSVEHVISIANTSGGFSGLKHAEILPVMDSYSVFMKEVNNRTKTIVMSERFPEKQKKVLSLLLAGHSWEYSAQFLKTGIRQIWLAEQSLKKRWGIPDSMSLREKGSVLNGFNGDATDNITLAGSNIINGRIETILIAQENKGIHTVNLNIKDGSVIGAANNKQTIYASASAQGAGSATQNLNLSVADSTIYSDIHALSASENSAGTTTNVNMNVARSYWEGNAYTFNSGDKAGSKLDINLSDGSVWKGKVSGAGDANVSLQNGSVWNVTGSSTVDALAVKDSTVNITKATVNTGTFASQNGTLIVDASSENTLDISGKASGDLSVYSAGSLDPINEQTAFISTGKDSTLKATGTTEGGLYQYDLTQGADGNFYFVKNTHKASNASSVIQAMAAAPANVANLQADTLSARQDAVRLSENDKGGVWIQYFGGKQKHTTAGNASYDLDVNGVMLGGDTRFMTEDGSWLAGVAMSSAKGDMTTMQSKGDTEGYSFHAYLSRQYNNGIFIDTAAQFGHYSNTADVRLMNGGGTIKADFNTNGFGAMVKGGYTWKDGNGLFIQPYAKLSALTLEGVDYQLNGVDVHSDSYNSVLGEAGTRVGYDFAVGNATVKPYLNLAALNEFSDGNKVRLGDESVNASIDGAAFRVGAGVQADITKNMGAYASLDYTKGDDIENPLQGVVGINVTW